MNLRPFTYRLLALGLASYFFSNIAHSDEVAPQQLVWKGASHALVFEVMDVYDVSMQFFVQPANIYLLDLQPDQDIDSLAAEISQYPGVEFCEPNYILNVPEPVQTSQPFVDRQGVVNFDTQEAASALSLPEAHAVSTGENIKVAVIDCGINYDHEVFEGMAIKGEDFVDAQGDASDVPGGLASGHGTFVAGMIHLVAPEATLVSYRVLNPDGRGDGFTIARAIVKAVNDGCSVINLSMVMTGVHRGMQEAIAFAYNSGVTIISAAGNDSSSVARFPADDPRTISVTAIDLQMQKADFANYGETIDFTAPGLGVYGPYVDSAYAWWNGTSFAAPFVAGQAAVIYSLRADASPNLVKGVMRRTALPVDYANQQYLAQLGAGLASPSNSANYALELVCGDVDGSGVVNIADVTLLIGVHFTGAVSNDPVLSDTNGDGEINVADVLYIINYIFLKSTPPICRF